MYYATNHDNLLFEIEVWNQERKVSSDDSSPEQDDSEIDQDGSQGGGQASQIGEEDWPDR